MKRTTLLFFIALLIAKEVNSLDTKDSKFTTGAADASNFFIEKDFLFSKKRLNINNKIMDKSLELVGEHL